MAEANRTYNLLFRFGPVVLILTFVIWGLLLVYWGNYAPTIFDPSNGRIYPYNNHGKIVYLNLTEQILQYALPFGAFGGGLVLRWLENKQKKASNVWPPEDIDYG